MPASGDILTRIVPSCVEALAVMQEVFTNPEQVMSKYILNIFHGKLQVSYLKVFDNCYIENINVQLNKS